MKRAIVTLAAIATLASCQKSDIDRMNDMRAPVIIKAIGGSDSFGDIDVILVDADGHLEYFSGQVFGRSKLGDTIVPSPWKPFKQGALMDKYAERLATRK